MDHFAAFNPADLTKDQNTLRLLHELLDELGEYDRRFVERLDLPSHRPRPLPERALISIVRLLQRARLLIWGVVDAIRAHNLLVALLCTRAHYETTGFLVFCLRRLRRLYEGEISQAEAQEAIDRVGLGSRRDPHGLGIEPPNVLSAVDETDTYIKEFCPENKKGFRENFDFLSEFCHPNAYGMTVIAKPADNLRIMDLPREPRFGDLDLGLVANHILLSSHTFLMAFDDTWRLLADHEQGFPKKPTPIVKVVSR